MKKGPHSFPFLTRRSEDSVLFLHGSVMNGIEKGHVQRGTTIPFSVSFVLGRMRGNFQMELVVKEFQPGRDERIVLENNYQYALTRSTILILSVEIQYDGLLAIRLIDENLNVIEMLGNFEYSPVCYKH